MGLSGLSLAWHRAGGGVGAALSLFIGAFAAIGFALLLALTVWRGLRHGDAVREDWHHPVRHAFFATLPISMILLATVAVAQGAPLPLAHALWVCGAALQFAVTVWVVSRWLRGTDGKLAWPSFTPVLFIPVVGNVLTPLAGSAVGHPDWAAAQFGIGLLLWPIVICLMAVRIGLIGLWPPRMLASTFITVAPPSVVGLAALQLQAPATLAWMAWGMALFFLAWSCTVVPRLRGQPFSLPFWGTSFPLAAFAALSLRLATGAGPAFTAFAHAALALATAVIATLVLLTLRGLLNGSLLQPEPAPPAPQTTQSAIA
ncbi:MAG: hypothetical protein RL014_2145 [Pseudomonadota bacterium]|jgi:tellurite resistance protein